MKLDSIHQLLVKWSTSEYGWLSSAITLEPSSIRAAKALSLIEINDTRRGLVDDSGAFFLRPDRWLCRWDLGVIVYSTLIKYTRCLKNTQLITSVDSLKITKNYKWKKKIRGRRLFTTFQYFPFITSEFTELLIKDKRNFTGFLTSGKKVIPHIHSNQIKNYPDKTLTISLWPKERSLRSRANRPSFQWSPYKGREPCVQRLLWTKVARRKSFDSTERKRIYIRLFSFSLAPAFYRLD